MNRNKVLSVVIVLVLVVCLFVVARLKTVNTPSSIQKQLTFTSGATIQLEIAETVEQQELGLSGRTSLKEGQGLWFPLAEENEQGMWMKDMLFPIDVFWFDKNMVVVDIKKDISPSTYPEIFYPVSDSLYVLEISAGAAEKMKIKVGDTASLVEIGG